MYQKRECNLAYVLAGLVFTNDQREPLPPHTHTHKPTHIIHCNIHQMVDSLTVNKPLARQLPAVHNSPLQLYCTSLHSHVSSLVDSSA